VDKHHAEVLGEICSQEMPLETSVQKPNFGILSLQVGFTFSFIQVDKTHLQSDLCCNVHTLCHDTFVPSVRFFGIFTWS